MGVEVAGARDNSGHAGADTVPFNEGFMPHLYPGHVREGVQGPRVRRPRYHAEVPGAAPGFLRPGAEGQGGSGRTMGWLGRMARLLIFPLLEGVELLIAEEVQKFPAKEPQQVPIDPSQREGKRR